METVLSIAEAVKTGERTAVSVAEATLGAIEKRDGSLHAFLSVTRDEMLAQARAVDDKRARGEPLGPLAGVPVALKDALCMRGTVTTAGSKILEGWRSPYDATVVARLKAADALIPGKTNLDEFAMGSSTERSAYGATKNPVDETRSPGGSSGGSAVAVAGGMAPASLGSDTGGSIRQPASFTGCVGLKPTYGRVSRFGLVAFASSLDQIGPFASDVRGAARVLQVIAGHDERDATSLALPMPDLEAACGASVKGTKLGVPAQYFASGLDPEVEASVRAAIARLEKDGCTIHPIELPHTKLAVATYYVIATAEASSNLARFDGVRYGLRVQPAARSTGSQQASALRAMYGATRDAGFGPEVKRRILLGTFVLSAGYYDAYYLKAQRVRTLIAREFAQAFHDVDAIVCPTAPTPAFGLGEKTSDPLSMYLSDIYTLPASLAGLPAISIPVAPAKSGLPIGFQIIGRSLDEATVLSVAAAAEASAR
ncbi:MAG: Asp-tRNA(Asn)/Glu-tRNA(Gln) amidotransferase subunit GatA [Labilithrix sp.]